MRRPPKQLADQSVHERDAGGPADEHHLVDLRRLEAGVGQRVAAGPERAIDDRPDNRLELRTCQLPAVQRGLFALGEVPLCLNDRLPHALHGFGIWRAAQVAEHALDQQASDVVAPEVRVAIGRQHLKHAVFHPENGDVERAAAEVDTAIRPVCRLSRP